MGPGNRPGPGGVCICTQCGYEGPHQRGIPCTQQKCPRCGMLMVRKDMVPDDVGPPMT